MGGRLPGKMANTPTINLAMKTVKRTLPRTVTVVAVVSLLNELSSQMVAPLIPILLASVLGAGPVALGLIEGTADAVASFLKLWSGRFSDRLGGRRKGLTVAGYTVSSVCRPFLGLAINWPMVLVLRSLDRIGKGIRSAPRDALVADATPQEVRGYAYGFQRALDYTGAVGGSLVAAAVLAWSSASIPQVIVYSAVPGLLAVLVLAVCLREETSSQAPVRKTPQGTLMWSALPPPLRRFLAVLALFTFARASETFILLRGHELGISPVELLLLWALLCLIQSVISVIGGKLADRLRKASLVAFTWGTYGLSFLIFASVTTGAGLWLAVILYSLFSGIGEGVERSFMSELAEPSTRGTAFGWYHMIGGIAAVPAGLLFGGIWHYTSAPWAFAVAGLLGLVAALLMVSCVGRTLPSRGALE